MDRVLNLEYIGNLLLVLYVGTPLIAAWVEFLETKRLPSLKNTLVFAIKWYVGVVVIGAAIGLICLFLWSILFAPLLSIFLFVGGYIAVKLYTADKEE